MEGGRGWIWEGGGGWGGGLTGCVCDKSRIGQGGVW